MEMHHAEQVHLYGPTESSEEQLVTGDVHAQDNCHAAANPYQVQHNRTGWQVTCSCCVGILYCVGFAHVHWKNIIVGGGAY